MQQVSVAGSTESPAAEPLNAQAASDGLADLQRRERKKRQTRHALLRAALALFMDKGYDHTAVREITDAVDISERTFFRYFANKEDLVLSFARDITSELMRELAARPGAEPPFTALRAAFRAAVTTLAAERDAEAGESVYPSIIRLIDSTPALMAAHMRYTHECDEEIAKVLAEREGIDPATDRRPWCAAAVFDSLLHVTCREWQEEDSGTVEDMLATFDSYCEHTAGALSGHWT
jgi:AcrR family transcriptional regulator